MYRYYCEALPQWRHQQVIGLNLVFIYIFKIVDVQEETEIKTNQPIIFPVIGTFPFACFKKSIGSNSEKNQSSLFSTQAYKIHPLSILNDHLITKSFSEPDPLCLAVVSCWFSAVPLFCRRSTAVVSDPVSSIRAGRGWRIRMCRHVRTFGTAAATLLLPMPPHPIQL